MADYEVEIQFAGMIGSEEYYDVEGETEEEAIDNALGEAIGDLNVENIEYIEDDEWEVEISFGGGVGVSEVYTVYAEDAEEAEQLAIDEAAGDLEGSISEQYAEERTLSGCSFDFAHNGEYTEDVILDAVVTALANASCDLESHLDFRSVEYPELDGVVTSQCGFDFSWEGDYDGDVIERTLDKELTRHGYEPLGIDFYSID